MHQKFELTDYLDNLELSFPAATYSMPRPILQEMAMPAAQESQAAPSPTPSSRVSQTVISPGAALKPLLLQDTREQVMIVDKSLISFVSGVSAGNRSDILESTLLAQLGAKAKVADESDIIGWYKAYIEILSKIGWTIEGGDVQTFSAKASVVEIQSIIIDILTSAFGAGLVQIISKALESIKTLADSNGKIVAFEKNTHSESSGSFQVGIATQEGGAVSINLGTFLIVSTNKIRHILFVKYSSAETDLKYASGKLTLDQVVYGKIRSRIRQKLSGRLTEFVAEIPI